MKKRTRKSRATHYSPPFIMSLLVAYKKRKRNRSNFLENFAGGAQCTSSAPDITVPEQVLLVADYLLQLLPQGFVRL